jgi:hypothetical protein
MTLEKELHTYERELPNLLAHEGKYVLIHNEDIVGIFGTYEDALKAGYERCGLDGFFVRQIQAYDEVQYFTREIEAA